MEISENHESNGPDNSESSVSQEGEDVSGMQFADSKDDLFVDASDDLDDARNADNRESVASTEAETSVSEEKLDDIQRQNHLVEFENGERDNHLLVAELERLREVLDKTVDERDSIEKKYKEERKTLVSELTNLRQQLKVLTVKELLPGENDGGLEQGVGESENKAQVGDASLHELMSECSQLLGSAFELWSQSENAIREINSVIHMKDQEIEVLNARVTELSISQDVASSYLNSVGGAASEVQLERDQYVEAVTDRMLAYLATVVNQEELLDYSISGKITHVEKNTYLLIEKYSQMLYEIYQLGHCLSKTEADLRVQEEFGTVFAAARNELLELKRREAELVEKVSHLDDENRKLVEHVEKDKEMVEAVNAELSKTKTELEQEKMRCTNTKEKLSLAVTKGKALVQQRDSLKQSLADKTAELEKCLSDLQEKSSALQVAELSKEELVKSENLVASLQKTLLQRNMILEKSEEILSQTDVPEELQSVDIVQRVEWLVNERNKLKVVSMDFYKLKDAISSFELPETISFPNLESHLGWLMGSFYQAKDEAKLLVDELDRTKEVARNEIDRLSASLLAELQEKEYVQKELDDLACKYEEIVQKADQVTVEKDQMMRMLVEESGIIMEDQDEVYQTYSDLTMLINKCFGKIREKTHASFDASGADIEMIERMQSLLYVKNQELMLCEQLLEEEALVRLQLNDMSNELRGSSEELSALKVEKDSLQKDLQRSEEKSSLLREKLSMAVKKGKGLVQDRENLKLKLDEKNSEIEKLRLNLEQQESAVSECKDQINSLLTDLENLKLQLDEKNSEIEKLRLDLQQQESRVSEYKDQINSLSTDLERIPKLEADVVVMKDQCDQLEQFLLESNGVLQRVVESIDRVVLPVGSVFEEPVEKVNWVVGFINECQDTKMHLEQELGKVKEEASSLASKFAEVQATTKSLEDALSVAEKKLTQLAEEKREIEVVKESVTQELEKAIEEARLETSKFGEACVSKKSLEDELSMAKNNISVLTSEKEEAQGSKAAALMELEKVTEEFASQTKKLTEAYKTIKSLEDSLTQVETTVAQLTEQNNVVEVDRTTLENEMIKLKDEAESRAVNLADAHTTIKSLEDALLKAENDIYVLEGEKRTAEEEISTLNSKLKACIDELAGTSGSLDSRSVELIGHLNDLHMLMKDERLLSILKQCFERKIESLQDIDLIIKDIMDQIVGKGQEVPLSHLDIKASSHVTKSFTYDLGNLELENGEVMVADADNISSCFRKTAEGFQLKNKILADKLEDFSTFVDEFIAALLRKLQTTREEVIKMAQSTESLEQKLKNKEVYKREHEEAMQSLEDEFKSLLSACSEATRELQFEVKNDLLELDSVPELGKLNHRLFQEVREVDVGDTAEHQKQLDGNNYIEAAEYLLFSARKTQTLTKLFESTSTVAASTIQDLQKKLCETTKAFEKAIEERDLHQNMVSKLVTDLDSLKDSYRELSLKVEDYQADKEMLNEKEAEISSLYNRLSRKEQEAEESLLSASQVRKLFDKITGIEIPTAESDVRDLEPGSSTNVKKLFYIIDSVAELQHQVNLLTHEKEELESSISTQTAEIEHLKGEVETHIRNKQDSEKVKSELSEFTFGLEKIINMLGLDEVVDQKSACASGVLPVLENQVMTLLSEAENSKSNIQELGTKLLGSQRFIDELTTKIKLLEDSIRGRTIEPELVQERSIFEAPSLPSGSEISEIEDPGTLGKKSISPVPSAAHVRTMRKGSTEHLAINIDSESALLVNEETDEDKGHVFKSLNTSGLIPKQGKMVADRIDGIWVSGGRVLMSRPKARLGVIAYCLLLHIWLLGTIL